MSKLALLADAIRIPVLLAAKPAMVSSPIATKMGHPPPKGLIISTNDKADAACQFNHS